MLAHLRNLSRLALPRRLVTQSASYSSTSSFLIDQPEYSFLKELGLERDNPGVYSGQWQGQGSSITSYDPGTGRPIATVRQGNVQELEQTIGLAVEAYKQSAHFTLYVGKVSL